MTNHHDRMAYQQQMFTSQIKGPVDSVSAEDLLLDSYSIFSLCPHLEEGAGALWGLLYKDANPMLGAPPHHPHQKAPHLTPSHWELDFTMNF